MSNESGANIKLDQLLFAPFKSSQESQILLSLSTLKYISDYGLDSSGNLKIVQINSSYYDASNQIIRDVSLNIPVVSLINIPCLHVKNVTIDLNINIRSQTIESKGANLTIGGSVGGLFSNSAKIETTGYVSSENSKSTGSTYRIKVEASDEKPLGLLMLYNFINTNRDIIRPVPGSANLNLKNLFG
jgi:hypothetical protein